MNPHSSALAFYSADIPRGQIALGSQGQSFKTAAFAHPDLHALATLNDSALPKGKIVKWEKKIAIVRCTLEIDGVTTPVYFKQHRVLSSMQRLASLVYPSTAMRSLRGAMTLQEKGYITALPLAVMEYRRRGLLTKSIYISEELPGAQTIDSYWLDVLGNYHGKHRYRLKRQWLEQLARLFRALHRDGIYHNDLKSANILAQVSQSGGQPAFALIDLQGVRLCLFMSWRRRIKNLAQLNRTLGAHLSRAEKLAFLTEYAAGLSLGPRAKRKLVRQVILQTGKQLLREQIRHPPSRNCESEEDYVPETAPMRGNHNSTAKIFAQMVGSNPSVPDARQQVVGNS